MICGTGSVSERRLATNHSRAAADRRSDGVYPSGDWPQTTAASPRCWLRLECIRAAIGHKPQRGCHSRRCQRQCIRAAIGHKPQQWNSCSRLRRECIRAAIGHKPQLSDRSVLVSMSVSERRLATNHSRRSLHHFLPRVYPSGDWPQTTAPLKPGKGAQVVYPSGDWPQTTASQSSSDLSG